MKDPSKHRRSMAKAITWETFSNLVCFFIAYIIFGNISGCILFTIIAFIVKLVLFYFHERLWHQVSWGKNTEFPKITGRPLPKNTKIDFIKPKIHCIGCNSPTKEEHYFGNKGPYCVTCIEAILIGIR